MGKRKVAAASLGQAMPSQDKPDPNAPPTDYETKDHLETLMKAHDIMNHPVKMKAVHALAGRHQKAIKSIKSVDDIEAYKQKKYGPKKQLSSLSDEDEEM